MSRDLVVIERAFLLISKSMRELKRAKQMSRDFVVIEKIYVPDLINEAQNSKSAFDIPLGLFLE
jgi:hypothetical protein